VSLFFVSKSFFDHIFLRRRLAQDLSHPLITMLQQECTRASCPEMKAGEWLYLCVAHGNEGAMEVGLSFGSTAAQLLIFVQQQCCAIDYILHTLDSATALLNSPRAFPSRFVRSYTHNLLYLYLTPMQGCPFLRRRTDISHRLLVVWAVFSRTPISTIGKRLSKPKLNLLCTPASLP
jgi:hypothetical protein